MGSSVFYNGSLAPYVHQPDSSTPRMTNQSTYYSNFVSEHIKLQEKYNETIKQYIKNNDGLIKQLAEEQKGLQRLFFKYEQNQMEKNEKFSKKMTEQKNLLEVFVGFMKKQEKFNETAFKQQVDNKEQLEVLGKIVKNQEVFNNKVSENMNLVKEQFEQIIATLKKHEVKNETISKHFDVKDQKDQEIVDTITEQRELFFKVLNSLQDNKEQYDILFDYVRNQDNFNHKLFEYLCSKFEEEENAVN
ncbi:hypothetical protein [Bacillus timonensis]|uniref:hypothetical protein n=1 Tax=Bacillus timonensis TaxID=1033734 RepID=UPI000289575A|nr:hypothetical protein [Bacillus timonensis]